MMMMYLMMTMMLKVELQTQHNDMMMMAVGRFSHCMLVDRLTRCHRAMN